MRASEFIIESQNATDVLKYVKSTHHDFHLDDTILTHPRWELKRVPVHQLQIPDPESGEDIDDPYNRVQMIDMYHVDDITARDIESKPIVVDTDGYIIDGNHRALAARLSGMKDIPAYVPVHQQDNRAGDIAEDLKITGPSANVKDWIAKVYKRFPDTWQNNHVMVWGSGEDQQFAMFELVPSVSKRDAVEVKWFQAYPLRQGVGSRAMRVLQDLSQADGITLTLYPWDKGQVSQAKLMKFYRSMGFIPAVKGSKNLAWTPNISNVDENFADGRKPGRKGLAKRMGVDCKQSVSKLRNIAKNSSGERQRMAHWCANMKSGQQKESQEQISEIERIPNAGFQGGKDHLEGERPGKIIKRLPGNSGFLYSIQSSRSSMKIAILDPENPQAQTRHGTPVALLTLSAERKFPGGAWRVDTITVDEEYRGAGLAKSLYGIVLAILKQTLVAGDMQTPGGRRNWVSLSQIPGVDVLGYVAISTYNLTNSDINTIMGKLGGQHLGKYGSYMYFAFPVAVNSTGKELEAIVKTKLSKVYGTDTHAEVGLFATWTGK